ncbi:MAG: hypothetical protein ACLQUY_02900 [Ktedonobacterales bacterium]
MRRDKPTEPWSASHTRQIMMARSFGDNPNEENGPTGGTSGGETASQIPASAIDHDRAYELIDEQTRRLLPPHEANALADHLLVCDRCFRYAQDVAHQERQSSKHSAVPREQSDPD